MGYTERDYLRNDKTLTVGHKSILVVILVQTGLDELNKSILVVIRVQTGLDEQNNSILVVYPGPDQARFTE